MTFQDSIRVILRLIIIKTDNILEVLVHLPEKNYEEAKGFLQTNILEATGYVVEITCEMFKAIQGQGYRIKRPLSGSNTSSQTQAPTILTKSSSEPVFVSAYNLRVSALLT